MISAAEDRRPVAEQPAESIQPQALALRVDENLAAARVLQTSVCEQSLSFS